jgi:hypothetical protein
LKKESGIKLGTHSLLSEEDLDAVLFESLPLFNVEQLPHQLRKLFSHMPSIPEERVEDFLSLYDAFQAGASPRLVTAEELQCIAKSLILLDRGLATTSDPIHREVAETAARIGLAMPDPIRFADTNWVNDYFALTYNPGTEQLELWRTNEVGRSAVPMHSWRQWLNGSKKKPDWGILNQPLQYWD